MSQYWAANTGIALHLSKSEAENMFQKYIKLNYPEQTVTDLLEEVDNQSWFEFLFLSSENRVKTKEKLPTLDAILNIDDLMTNGQLQKNTFNMFPVNLDYQSGLTLFTIREIDSQIIPNLKTWNAKSITDGFIIYGKSCLPQDILSGKSYQSIDDMVIDFKHHLNDYLPNDFDWKDHIGYLQMATYG